MKKYLLLLCCILNMQYGICSEPSTAPVAPKKDSGKRILKECVPNSEILGLVKSFVDRFKKDLDRDGTLIYLLFGESYYSDMQSIEICSYADDNIYYNTLLINDDMMIGYFPYDKYWCVVIQYKSSLLAKDKFTFTGLKRTFQGMPFSMDQWPDVPSIWINYDYKNNKFIERKSNLNSW